MNTQKRRKGRSSGNRDWQRYLRILALPLIVVILILVIVLTDREPGTGTVSTEDTEISSEEAVTPAEEPVSEEPSEETGDTEMSAEEPSDGDVSAAAAGQEAETADETGLKHNEIPEITALMEAYCEAKTDCDAEAMYALYGKTDMTGVEELRQRMQYRAKYVQSIENVDCYTLPGMEDNTYVVYVTADIRFQVTETLAPTIMWCYVRMEEDGTYHIVENITAEEAEYAAKAEQSEPVRRLAAQVNDELEVAVSADSRLASAYGMLKDGTAVPGSNQTPQTTAAETAAADTEAQAETAEETSAP